MFLLRGHWFIKRAISSLMKYQCSAQQVNNLTRLMVIAHVQKFCWFHKPALLAASGNSWVLGAKSGEQQHATFRRHGARGCTGSLEPAFLPAGGSCNGVQGTKGEHHGKRDHLDGEVAGELPLCLHRAQRSKVEMKLYCLV